MAERRMFAKTIIDSDAFLDMPMSAQCLYFHLAMRADDEGFVNSPKKIQRTVGAADDDAKLLIAKNFIIPFESGVVVIKHWRIHNYIQNDRRKPTNYQEERALLSVKPNGAYTLDTECIHDVSRMETQVRLGKDSIGKDRDSALFAVFWDAYPKKVGKQAAFKSFSKALAHVSVDTMVDAIEQQKKSDQWRRDNGRFIPNPTTWLNQGRWEDVVDGDSGQDNDSRWGLRADIG